jgi:tetratricopeptide (TPR) repeat protein
VPSRRKVAGAPTCLLPFGWLPVPPFPPPNAPPARRPAIVRPRDGASAPPPQGGQQMDGTSAAPPRRGHLGAEHATKGLAGPELRLAIGPGGLGIELARPVALACVSVSELSMTIPGVRFPLDVSGGVSRFRHRRGRLQRVALELSTGSLARWLGPRLAGILGVETPAVWVSVRAAGATLGLFERRESSASPKDRRLAPRILAFEVALDAEGDDLRLCVYGARGAGLPAPAVALAIRVVHEAIGEWATREGSSFRLRAVSGSIARALLPDAGVRAPDAAGVRWTGLGAQEDAWLLIADDAGARAGVTEEGMRAREAAAITRSADDALFAGDLDGAREKAVAALERAPRHRELCRRIADIDRVAHGRAEAALATMVEADRRDADKDGLLVADLLGEVGDTDAAVASLVRLGETEAVAPLAARAFERAAELTADPHDALVWLDMALARAPAVARLRWSRLVRRLAAGRIEDALADAEHLEAQASGTSARHAVWKRAGEAWGKAGRAAEAGALYERALRFDPHDPEAFAGLGRALLASHRVARGTALLARAVDLAASRGDPAPHLVLELAEALAVAMDDRPAAIARVVTIASRAREALRARGLEGRWRKELGDVAGASFAFARMRELADGLVSDAIEGTADGVPALLVEAAEFEERVRDDLWAAQRHLACALRLAPHDPSARDAYREVGFRIAGATPSGNAFEIALRADESGAPPRASNREPDRDLAPDRDPDPESESQSESDHDPERNLVCELDLEPDLEGVDEAEDAARVEELTRKLHADPSDDRVVDELCERLLRLGRTHELLALLSARLEDAPPERRASLIPRQREVLERLMGEAREAGRAEEASLFEYALSALDG